MSEGAILSTCETCGNVTTADTTSAHIQPEIRGGRREIRLFRRETRSTLRKIRGIQRWRGRIPRRETGPIRDRKG
jgi:hypothetical protein